MQTDCLEDDVSLPVIQAVYVDLPSLFEPDLFFDGESFLIYLNSAYTAFDVATYSFTNKTPVFTRAPLSNIKRLITGLPFTKYCCIKPEQHRLVINNHSKIFLCYQDKHLDDVFIGSQNLSHGTNINLMYRVAANHRQPIKQFFNSMWKAAKPFATK